MGQLENQALDRRHAVNSLLADRGDLLVVTGLGSPSYDVMAAGDHDNNYYLWGAMGSAAMVGFGLAQSQPDRKVLVITGDGEILMGMGSLATIGIYKPSNLTIAILDNGHYGETGMQLSHSGMGIELEKVADSCGFEWSERIDSEAGIDDLRSRIHRGGCLNFARVLIDQTKHQRVIPPRDGVHVKNRIRASLGFSTI